ncbi:MAG: hypothetical protein AAF587_35015 [Bacteroidota bacterium]
MDSNLEKWASELDELEIQISLGEEEYVDAFEEQKSKFLQFAESTADAINQQVEKYGVSEKADSLVGKLDELRLQLALGKADSKDAFEEQREKIEGKLSDCSSAYEEYKQLAGEKADEWGDAFSKQLESFQTKMDVFRLHFALGSADAQEEWKEKKKEFKTQIADLRQKAEKRGEKQVEEAEEKWEEVKDDLSEAYDHMKSALKRLFT